MAEAKENTKESKAEDYTILDQPKIITNKNKHARIYRGELGRTQYKREMQNSEGATKEKTIEVVKFGDGKGKKVIATKEYLRSMTKNGKPMFTR
jgi:hypothetical protein